MLEAVIFDMDGVLVDSEGYYINLFGDFLRRFGAEPDERIMNTIPGASASKTWEIMASMWSKPTDPNKLRALFHETYPDYCPPYADILFHGVKETLQELRELGYKLALASSTSMDYIRVMLEQTGMEGYFLEVVSGRSFKESKPDPQIYLHTARQMGVEPSACVAVEDSPYGIMAGKNAGMTVIAKKEERFHFDQSDADLMIDDICELPAALNALEASLNNALNKNPNS